MEKSFERSIDYQVEEFIQEPAKQIDAKIAELDRDEFVEGKMEEGTTFANANEQWYKRKIDIKKV